MENINIIKDRFTQSYLEFKSSLVDYEKCNRKSDRFITYLKAFLKSYENFIENLVSYMVEKFDQKYNEKITVKTSMEKIKIIYEKVRFNEKEFQTLQELIKLRNKTVHEYYDISSEKQREKTVKKIKSKTSHFDYIFDNKQRILVVKEIDKMLPALKKIGNKKIREDDILPISLEEVSKILAIAGVIGVGLGVTALGISTLLKKFTEKK